VETEGKTISVRVTKWLRDRLDGQLSDGSGILKSSVLMNDQVPLSSHALRLAGALGRQGGDGSGLERMLRLSNQGQEAAILCWMADCITH